MPIVLRQTQAIAHVPSHQAEDLSPTESATPRQPRSNRGLVRNDKGDTTLEGNEEQASITQFVDFVVERG